MEVLTVFLEEDREKAEVYLQELAALDINCIEFSIPRKWDKRSIKHIYEKDYLFLVNSGNLEKESWFFYLSGYHLGRDSIGVLAGEGLSKDAPGAYGWKVLREPSAVKEYFRTEKIQWDRKEEIRLSGEELHKRGYNLNEDSMVFAVSEGDIDAVILFMTAGFSPEGRDGRGTPILSIAASRGYVEIMEILIDRGAKIDSFSKDRHNTALMDAAAEGRTEAAQLLLEAGAGLEYRSKNGQTALILAVGQKHMDTARLLLEKGADPEIKDSLGMSGAGYARLFQLGDLGSLMGGGEGAKV